jgi:hypothetical protein
MGPVPSPNNIGFDQNCQNSFNIQSPTRLGAVHIKTDAQVTKDIQLGHSWTHWKDKGKEITFPMEIVHVKIHLESAGIVEIIGCPESILVLATIFVLWVVYIV